MGSQLAASPGRGSVRGQSKKQKQSRKIDRFLFDELAEESHEEALRGIDTAKMKVLFQKG